MGTLNMKFCFAGIGIEEEYIAQLVRRTLNSLQRFYLLGNNGESIVITGIKDIKYNPQNNLENKCIISNPDASYYYELTDKEDLTDISKMIGGVLFNVGDLETINEKRRYYSEYQKKQMEVEEFSKRVTDEDILSKNRKFKKLVKMSTDLFLAQGYTPNWPNNLEVAIKVQIKNDILDTENNKIQGINVYFHKMSFGLRPTFNFYSIDDEGDIYYTDITESTEINIYSNKKIKGEEIEYILEELKRKGIEPYYIIRESIPKGKERKMEACIGIHYDLRENFSSNPIIDSFINYTKNDYLGVGNKALSLKSFTTKELKDIDNEVITRIDVNLNKKEYSIDFYKGRKNIIKTEFSKMLTEKSKGINL